jgi:hypothetical protein
LLKALKKKVRYDPKSHRNLSVLVCSQNSPIVDIPAVADVSEPLYYSDEYIQSIYSNASASTKASNRTSATARFSIEDSISEVPEGEGDAEKEPYQRSSSSFMPVPPSMANHPIAPSAMGQSPSSRTIQPRLDTMKTATISMLDLQDNRKAASQKTEKRQRPTSPKSTDTKTRVGGTTAGAFLAHHWNRVFRRYYAMKLVGMLMAIYTAILTFTYAGTFGKYGGVLDPETGFIVDRMSEKNTAAGLVYTGGVKRAVVAATSFELVAFAIARLTAFYMYPGRSCC